MDRWFEIKEYKDCQLVRLKLEQLKDMVIKYVLELKQKSKNTAGKPIRGETSVNSIKTYVAGINHFWSTMKLVYRGKR